MVKNKIFTYTLLTLATLTIGAMDDTSFHNPSSTFGFNDDVNCMDASDPKMTELLSLFSEPKAPDSPRPFSGVNREALPSIPAQELIALPLPPAADAQPSFVPQEQANAAEKTQSADALQIDNLAQGAPTQTQDLDTKTQSEKQLYESSATEPENEANDNNEDESNETNNSDDNNDESEDQNNEPSASDDEDNSQESHFEDTLKKKITKKPSVSEAAKGKTASKTHTKEKRFKCTYNDCKKGFSDRRDLNRHIRTHTGEKPFQCDQCVHKTTNKSNIEHHKKTHVPDSDFKCREPECNKNNKPCCFKSPVALSKHIQVNHPSKFKKSKAIGEEPYQCDQCVHKTTNKSNMKQHKKTHVPDSDFKCTESECNKNNKPCCFRNAYALSQHNRRNHPDTFKESERKRKFGASLKTDSETKKTTESSASASSSKHSIPRGGDDLEPITNDDDIDIVTAHGSYATGSNPAWGTLEPLSSNEPIKHTLANNSQNSNPRVGSKRKKSGETISKENAKKPKPSASSAEPSQTAHTAKAATISQATSSSAASSQDTQKTAQKSTPVAKEPNNSNKRFPCFECKEKIEASNFEKHLEEQTQCGANQRNKTIALPQVLKLLNNPSDANAAQTNSASSAVVDIAITAQENISAAQPTQKVHPDRQQLPHIKKKPHQCTWGGCNKSFARKHVLDNHMNTHTGERNYKCDRCIHSVIQKQDLDHHKETHTDDSIHQCTESECQNKNPSNKCCFRSIYALAQHNRINHPDKYEKIKQSGEKSYKCDRCIHSVIQKRDLDSHKETHTDDSIHQCTESECQNKNPNNKCCFTSIKTLSTHNRINHPDKYEKIKSQRKSSASLKTDSETKNATQSSASSADASQKTENEPSVFCPQCNYGTSSNDALQEHVKQCTGINKNRKILPCVICNEKFNKKLLLINHYRQAHECNETTAIKLSQLYTPEAYETFKQQAETYDSAEEESDDDENTIFKQKSAAQSTTFRGPGVFQCIHAGCNNFFAWQRELDHHKSLHEKYPHQCKKPACLAFFATQETLEKHMKEKHTQQQQEMNEKEILECDICGKIYFKQNSLRRHVEQHKTHLYQCKEIHPNHENPDLTVRCLKLFKSQVLLDSHQNPTKRSRVKKTPLAFNPKPILAQGSFEIIARDLRPFPHSSALQDADNAADDTAVLARIENDLDSNNDSDDYTDKSSSEQRLKAVKSTKQKGKAASYARSLTKEITARRKAVQSSATSTTRSYDIQPEENQPESELVQTTNRETIVCEHCTKLQGMECVYEKKDFEYHFSFAHPALCSYACEKQCGHCCYTQELLDKHNKECTHTAQMDVDHNAPASSSSATSLDQGAPISHAEAQPATMDTQDATLSAPAQATSLTTIASVSTALSSKKNKKTKMYTCDKCNKNFATAVGLQNHKKSPTACKPYGCQKCGQKFHTKELAEAHQANCKNTQLLCECGYETYRQDKLKEHQNTNKHKEAMAQRNRAIATASGENDVTFSAASAQPAAMDTQDATLSAPAQATSLTAIASVSTALLSKKNKKTKIYTCEKCNKSFSRADGLQYHKQHIKTSCKPHECQKCGQKFPTKEQAEAHQASCKKTQLLCECGYQTYRQENLNDHQKSNKHKEAMAQRNSIYANSGENDDTSSAASAEQVSPNASAQNSFMSDDANSQQHASSITALVGTQTHKLPYCPYCRFKPSTPSELEAHNATDKHKQKVAQMIAVRNHTFASASGSTAQPKAPSYPPGLKEAERLYYQRHLQGPPARTPLPSQYPKPNAMTYQVVPK